MEKGKNDTRSRNGFLFLGLGGFIGFLSCVFTMLELIPSLTGFFLYGLTTVAVVLALLGCYLIFEK